jgi:long-chain acyl-CoA synthetase
VRNSPDRSALVYLGEHFSYRSLKDLSERFAGALSTLGVAKGHRVMIYIPNCVQWVIAFLGIQNSARWSFRWPPSIRPTKSFT